MGVVGLLVAGARRRPRPDVSSTSSSSSKRPGATRFPNRSSRPRPVGAPLLGRADLVVAAAHSLVPWADTADVIMTAAGRFDPATVQLTPHRSVDGARRLFEVPGPATPRRRRRSPPPSTAACCGVAAQQCGLADRMLEITVDYVKEREQFGVPVGSFQAVKHHLANARLALEFARPARLPRRGDARPGARRAWPSRRPTRLRC